MMYCKNCDKYVDTGDREVCPVCKETLGELSQIDYVVNEMCKRVGATLNDIKDRKEPESDWFRRYTWTEEEEESFKGWLTDHLLLNTRARRAIMEHPSRARKLCAKTAYWFVWNYGWKVAP